MEGEGEEEHNENRKESHGQGQGQPVELPLKATFELQQPARSFFYAQNHIVARCTQAVAVVNVQSRTTEVVATSSPDFVLEQLPPYLFAVMEGRFLHAYRVGTAGLEAPVAIRISKLQPRSICRFNKGYYLGGYNRSFLPGNKRTTTRLIYFLDSLRTDAKNRPADTVKLPDSDCPVSALQVQNPYLFAYCRPALYLLSIHTKEILITFEKDATDLLLLEGRFAHASVNGVGISSRHNIFTFDIERYPLFGVEINEHAFACESLCMERTGRIFGARGAIVFEYHPVRRHAKTVVLYPAGQWVLWVCCTPSNNLMVLRTHSAQNPSHCTLDVYALD